MTPGTSPRSSVDRVSASEAEGPGSSPGGGTKCFHSYLTCARNPQARTFAADDPRVKSPLALPTPYVATGVLRVTIGGTARAWWKALHQEREAGRMPATLEPIAGGSDGEVIVSPAEWTRIKAWGASLPDWTERDGIDQLVSEEVLEG